jgi:hypothetical protein
MSKWRLLLLWFFGVPLSLVLLFWLFGVGPVTILSSFKGR